MLRFKDYLTEFVKKGTWEHLMSKDKEDYSADLIKLVDNAYKHTTLGSFVKSINDIKNSEWLVLDYDPNPELDIAIFYRGPRANENWKGYKIQGVGHDGQMESKVKMMAELVKVLSKDGYWIEASERMEAALRKANVRVEKDNLKNIFPSIEKINPDGSYVRTVDGNKVKETIFGKPKV